MKYCLIFLAIVGLTCKDPSLRNREIISSSHQIDQFPTDSFMAIVDDSRAHRLNILDTNYYIHIISASAGDLFKFNEAELSDGLWVFCRDKENRWPIMISEIKNNKKEGAFFYADSSIKLYYHGFYHVGLKNGSFYHYNDIAVLTATFKYANGKLVDTSFGFSRRGSIDQIRIFDSVGNVSRLINYQKWPDHKKSETFYLIDKGHISIEYNANGIPWKKTIDTTNNGYSLVYFYDSHGYLESTDTNWYRYP